MDFVTGLPKYPKGRDVVWIMVARLTKSAHFIPVKSTDSTKNLGKLYVRDIARLHGIPILIISDRDSKCTSKVWGSLQKVLGTQLNLVPLFIPKFMDKWRELFKF